MVYEPIMHEMNCFALSSRIDCEGLVNVRSGKEVSIQILRFAIFSFTVLVFPATFVAAADSIAVSAGLSKINDVDLKKHVSTLAADGLEGREAGARGGKAAAAYLRSVLQSMRQAHPVPREKMQEFGNEYQNLLVLLPGADEKLKREVIVVGAHYDHVGYGKQSNSQGPIGQVHNGADDNASGTAALLELIEAFSAQETAPSRSILFAFWDAEEVGLLGSKHWVANPTVPLQNVRFNLNIDMIGRLREGRVITVGWRSAPGLRSMLASHNVTNELLLAFQPRVIADSDHYPFYAAGIPAIHLDTDKHYDYHRPSDDVDKLNWDGLKTMTGFCYRIVLDMANRPELPNYRREATLEGVPTWLNAQKPVFPPSRLGVTWEFEVSKRDIASVSRIASGSPAAKAGLRPGDRVVRFGPWQNGSFNDLKTVLQIVRNPVEIRVERPGIDGPIDFTVDLLGNPVRLGAGWIDDATLPDCAVITHVISESPADRAGLAAGDVILEMGGRTITSSEEMRLRVLDELGPFRFRVERQGRIRDVVIELMDGNSEAVKMSRLP